MSEIKKIGMYTTDEILEHLTEGEGRGFLGRSMYDAIYFKIEEPENQLQQKENIIKGLDNTIENLEEVVEHKENIIKEVREYFKNHTLKYDDLMLIKPSDVFEILDKTN